MAGLGENVVTNTSTQNCGIKASRCCTILSGQKILKFQLRTQHNGQILTEIQAGQYQQKAQKAPIKHALKMHGANTMGLKFRSKNLRKDGHRSGDASKKTIEGKHYPTTWLAWGETF